MTLVTSYPQMHFHIHSSNDQAHVMSVVSLQVLLKNSKRVDLDAVSIELTTEDFSFASIDAFVRSRFGIEATEKLIFSREGRNSGGECLNLSLCLFIFLGYH